MRPIKRVVVRLISLHGTAGLLLAAGAGTSPAQTYTLRVAGASDGDGVVTSVPAGINCTVTDLSTAGTCTASFAAGTTVTLTAVPAVLNTFGQWSGQSCGAAPSCQVVMSQNTGMLPIFIPTRYTLTIAGTGTGYGRIIGDRANTFLGQTNISCRTQAGSMSGACTSQFPANKRIKLRWETALDAAVYFIGFDAPCVDAKFECNAVMTGPLTVTARFDAAGFRVKSARGGGSGRITSTGGNTAVDCVVSPAGETGVCSDFYNTKLPGAGVTLDVTPAPGSRFVGWSGACSGAQSCKFQPGIFPSVPEIFANFALETATLAVTGAGTGGGGVVSTPSGVNCSVLAGSATGSCSAPFAGGSEVVLQAAPTGGSRFAGWSGPCSGIVACSLTLSVSQSVMARFDALTPVVTVAGAGSGTIASTPGGISCTLTDGTASGACSAPFAYASDVALAATPAAGWAFGGWGGACTGTGACRPDLTTERTVSATFVRATVTLNITGAGTGSGIVTSSPNGLSCVVTKGAGSSSGCSTSVVENTAVTLTADPQGGSIFAGWSGDGCSGTELSCTLTPTRTRNIVARFTAPRPGRDLALALLGGVTLPLDERRQLDRFGNNDGAFNLGDVLALLDRTGERLTPSTASALAEVERRANAAPFPPQRRTP